MAISTAIATILTNIITQVAKPLKKDNMTEKEKKKRRRYVRLFSAFISAVTVIGTSLILGDAIPTEELSGALETIVSVGLTFVGSQGTYFLSTRQ